MVRITRRQVLGFSMAEAAVAGIATATYLTASPPKTVETFYASDFAMIVYRSPTCGCCE